LTQEKLHVSSIFFYGRSLDRPAAMSETTAANEPFILDHNSLENPAKETLDDSGKKG